jgi:DNA-binding beta-propeller fold protein YncE
MTIFKRLGAFASIGLLAVASHSVIAAEGGGKLRVIQNAMAGDAVTIIDPLTNTVVGEIPGIEISNGIAVSPDGSRIYATGEVEHALFVADSKTLKWKTKVPLTGRPSAVAVAKDGSRIFVGIQDSGGTGMDIVDATTLKVIKNLPLEGMKTHYIFVTPDGKYAAATANSGGSGPDRNKEALTIRLVDTKTGEFVRKFSGEGTGGHRMCDFYPNPDGSTKWVLCNQGGLSGFVVYDFETGAIVKRVTNPNQKVNGVVRLRSVESAQGSPSHGVAVSPDHKLVVVSDRWYNLVHVYSAPDFTHLYSVPMAVDPFWFAFTPDSKTVYASAAFSEMVSAIDLEKRKEVARIRVQAEPKRVVVAMLR